MSGVKTSDRQTPPSPTWTGPTHRIFNLSNLTRPGRPRPRDNLTSKSSPAHESCPSSVRPMGRPAKNSGILGRRAGAVLYGPAVTRIYDLMLRPESFSSFSNGRLDEKVVRPAWPAKFGETSRKLADHTNRYQIHIMVTRNKKIDEKFEEKRFGIKRVERPDGQMVATPLDGGISSLPSSESFHGGSSARF